MAYKIAIVGATGNVGRNILSVLEERNFPVGEVFLLASTKSVGREIRFKGQDVKVQDLALFDFSKVSIAFFSAGSNISKDYAPKAASCGAVVIDNTSFFRVEKDIPLVVPLVNPQDVALYKNRNIIANPNCSTAQTSMFLSRIFFVSTSIFHSSFVLPSSINTSISGRQLKAICFGNTFFSKLDAEPSK